MKRLPVTLASAVSYIAIGATTQKKNLRKEQFVPTDSGVAGSASGDHRKPRIPAQRSFFSISLIHFEMAFHFCFSARWAAGSARRAR